MDGSREHELQYLIMEETLLGHFRVTPKTFKHHRWSTFIAGSLCQVIAVGTLIRNYTTGRSLNCSGTFDIEVMNEYKYELTKFHSGAYIVGAIVCFVLLLGIWQEMSSLIKTWMFCDVIIVMTITGLHLSAGVKECCAKESVLAMTNFLLHMFTVAMATDLCFDIKKVRPTPLSEVQETEVETITHQSLSHIEVL